MLSKFSHFFDGGGLHSSSMLSTPMSSAREHQMIIIIEVNTCMEELYNNEQLIPRNCA